MKRFTIYLRYLDPRDGGDAKRRLDTAMPFPTLEAAGMYALGYISCSSQGDQTGQGLIIGFEVTEDL